MQEVEQLGDAIECAWRAAEYRSEEFAEIASAALAEHKLTDALTAERIFRWFTQSPRVPRQPADVSFGEPPIQLYAGRQFFIDALFWLDGTTSIHQHSFSGAFQVLSGGSVHTRYAFEPSETINRELVLGKLTAGTSELLGASDIRPIWAGDRFIHSLFHLERPSITLVVRTTYDAGTDPQYTYLHPGIAYSPFPSHDRASRLPRLVNMLEPEAPMTAQLLTELAKTADLWTAVLMLVQWFRIHPVDDVLADQLLAVIARRHAGLAARLRGAFHEERRQALIIHRRRPRRRADHRFFLAMLLNVGDRARILELVEQRYPGQDPLNRIIGWIAELAAPAEQPTTDYNLGEAELKILHYLLRQQTPEQVISALQNEYEDVDDQRAEILSLCSSLTNSALFRSLFQVSP